MCYYFSKSRSVVLGRESFSNESEENSSCRSADDSTVLEPQDSRKSGMTVDCSEPDANHGAE